MKATSFFLALILLMMFASSIWAGVVPNYIFAPDVIASGGQVSTSANYSFAATLGQPLIDAGHSASYSTCVGFWCEAVSEYQVYLPLVLKN